MEHVALETIKPSQWSFAAQNHRILGGSNPSLYSSGRYHIHFWVPQNQDNNDNGENGKDN